MEKAVILAGGKGLRFGANSEDVPKPMSIVCGKPILHYIVTMLKSLGFKKLYIIVGYKKEIVIDNFGSGRQFGLEIEYVDNSNINHAKKSGLSDAVLLMKGVINEPFMTILGDEIYAYIHRCSCKDKLCNTQFIEKQIQIRTKWSGILILSDDEIAGRWNQLWNDLYSLFSILCVARPGSRFCLRCLLRVAYVYYR